VRSAPSRRPGSVRRTTTLDFTWPDGLTGDSVLDARARDLHTGADGTTTVLAEAALDLVADQGRIIRRITPTPDLPGLDSLVGESAMPGFRRRLGAAVTPAQVGGSALFQLLDDVPGATLVSGAAWQPWYDLDEYRQIKADVTNRVMTNICAGYQEGSSALQMDGTLRWTTVRPPAVDIDAVDDLLAWHQHPDPAGVTMRRARRIDVWVSGSSISVEAFFQDSSTLPGGGRQAIHEYTLTAEADLDSGNLRWAAPVARVLPYPECPLAVPNVAALAGLPLASLRATVLERLRGPLGCTHLNDMLRALAGVPELARTLSAVRS
jgi:hypothetical protein